MEKKTFFKIVVMLAFLVAGFWQAAPGRAAAPAQEAELPIYFFWGDGCPHCADEKPFLKDLAAREPRITLYEYEIWYNKTNLKLLEKMAETMGFEVKGVPTTIIGERQ